MKCINCNEETVNPKFCSRSCAATYNNKISPKRRGEGLCSKCGKLFAKSTNSRRADVCLNCVPSKIIDYKLKTIGEYRSKDSVKNLHRSSIHSHIRNFNRSWNKDLCSKPCANCGYNKHVELCHIKSISDFPDNALLGEVNSKDNVIQLCRNCHWEFDNGLLII